MKFFHFLSFRLTDLPGALESSGSFGRIFVIIPAPIVLPPSLKAKREPIYTIYYKKKNVNEE